MLEQKENFVRGPDVWKSHKLDPKECYFPYFLATGFEKMVNLIGGIKLFMDDTSWIYTCNESAMKTSNEYIN